MSAKSAMFDLIIIGAGPGGIALAAEGAASGLTPSQMLVLEEGLTHNSAIRQLYPEQKPGGGEPESCTR